MIQSTNVNPTFKDSSSLNDFSDKFGSTSTSPTLSSSLSSSSSSMIIFGFSVRPRESPYTPSWNSTTRPAVGFSLPHPQNMPVFRSIMRYWTANICSSSIWLKAAHFAVTPLLTSTSGSTADPKFTAPEEAAYSAFPTGSETKHSHAGTAAPEEVWTLPRSFVDVEDTENRSLFHGILREALECLHELQDGHSNQGDSESAPHARARDVTTPPCPAPTTRRPAILKPTLNILLAISRPEKDKHIDPYLAFKSISGLLMDMKPKDGAKFRLEVSRPGMWSAFNKHISSRTEVWHASGGDCPWFDVVHFDVHGVVRDEMASERSYLGVQVELPDFVVPVLYRSGAAEASHDVAAVSKLPSAPKLSVEASLTSQDVLDFIKANFLGSTWIQEEYARVPAWRWRRGPRLRPCWVQHECPPLEAPAFPPAAQFWQEQQHVLASSDIAWPLVLLG
ncbi:hypothetical protein B0H63DRAFT_557069 [Podospora didyma]|uniref:Uncharacterized protein n=1 Tax=Podospora didyma TaxID=330526 RepID=A0AAE0U3Z7_9PEZI|nr:hypothetical protein B0H63DRAFT_557069 [Podospora didyma]